MAWLRLYDSLASDHKVMQLDCTHFKTWVLCLCNAKKNDGTLSELGPLAFELHLREDVLAKHLEVLEAAGLLDRNGLTYQPHNWSKFQYSSDTSTERSKKHRKRLKGVACNVAGTLPELHSNALRVQSTDTDNKTTLSPLLLRPRSAVGDWVEKIRAAHPKGSSEQAVAVWFAEQEQRLGDLQAFDDFAARVWRSHVAYCEYWAQSGTQYATKLEEWLRGGHYDKTPPRAVSGQMRRLVDLLPPGDSHVG